MIGCGSLSTDEGPSNCSRRSRISTYFHISFKVEGDFLASTHLNDSYTRGCNTYVPRQRG